MHERENLVWIPKLNVCTHWRAVAIDCAELWARIPLRTKHWTDLMLARSKNAPISIVWPYPYSKNPTRLEELVRRVADAVSQHSYHLSALHLALGEEPCHRLQPILQIMHQHAPILHYLTMDGSVYRDRQALPIDLFQGVTPRLRHVTLRGFNIMNWNSGIFKNITHLSIQKSAQRPTVNQLLDLLENAAQLQAIDLYEVLPGYVIEHTPHRTVPLPDLAFIALNGLILECSQLLACLVYPASAKLVLWCQGGNATGVEFSSIDSNIEANITYEVEAGYPRALHISESGNRNSYGLKFHAHRDDGEDPNLALNLTWPLNVGTIAARRTTCLSVLHAVLPKLQPKHIRHLALGPTSSYTNAEWHFILRQTMSIIHLEMEEPAAQTVICELYRTRNLRESASPLVPLLKILTFREVGFGNLDGENRTLIRSSKPSKPEPSTLFQVLHHFLMTKRRQNRKIHTVTFKNCTYIDDKKIALLKGIGVEVLWDTLDDGGWNESSNGSVISSSN